jgi:hypothetical protein
MKETARKQKGFEWDERKQKAAEAIAKGDRSVKEILAEFKITEAMFYRWKKHPEFQRKIDEIIQDIDIAQKSERIRIAKKVIRQKMEQDAHNLSKKDLLDWLKYVGEEMGDYSEHKDINISGEGVIFYIPENNRDKKEKDK